MKKEEPFHGPLDFSWLLDAPAGKDGFLRIRDGHIFKGNDERIRFYGFNFHGNANAPEKPDAEIIANRLASAGMNIVRLHATDSHPWRRGGKTQIDYTGKDSRSLDAEVMDRQDYFIHCLKEKGIYVQVDLYCYRYFLPGDDLDYPDDMQKYTKQVTLFNRRLIDLQKEFATDYLSHYNPYNELKYMDDPCVALVQVMNEDGIFWYEARDEIGFPSYHKELDDRWNAWLIAKYGSRKALDLVWTKDDGTKCLLDEENPEQSTVCRLPHLEGTQQYVNWKDDYRGLGSPARYADYTEFLTWIQLNFSREMRDHLLALGVKVPINITNHAQGAADIFSLDKYADVNMDNGYWNHPDTVKRDEPRYHDINMGENDPRQTVVDNAFKLNLVTRLNHDRVAGKPFIAGEWNILWGTQFRSDGLPMVAAYACLQDWDGMILYAYHYGTALSQLDDARLEGAFSLYNDPAVWGQVGLCSAIFQQGLVAAGKNKLEVCYSERDLYAVPRNWIAPYGYASYVSQVAARFMDDVYTGSADVALASGNTPTGDYSLAAHALVYSRSPYRDGAQKYNTLEQFLARHRPPAGTLGTRRAILENGNDMDADYRTYSRILDAAMKKWGLLSENQGLVDEEALISDTGELRFDFRQGVFTIDAPGMQLRAGNIAGRQELGDFLFDIRNEKMTLSLLPLDEKPLAQSTRMLLIALGWSGNDGMVFEDQGDGSKIMRSEGHAPVLIDSLEGLLTASGPVQVYPLTPSGERMDPLPTMSNSVWFGGSQTMYFEIIKG